MWLVATRGFRSDGFHWEDPSSLLGQLGSGLRVRVEHFEVGDDDRHRQSDSEDSSEGAQRPHKHSQVRLGSHVTISHGCHGHNGPPQTHWNRLEAIVRVVLDPFCVVDERGKDDDADDEEEDEKGQLMSRCLEGVDEDLETW